MEISVVPGTRLDETQRRELVALVNDAFAKHRWLFDTERTDDEGFQEEVAESDVIVMTRDRVAVAMGYVREEEGALYLGMVVVRPAEQGKGYGAAVLREAEVVARRRGLEKVTLTTVPQLGSQPYWERHGFRPVSERPMPLGHWSAQHPWSLVTMEKVLPRAI